MSAERSSARRRAEGGRDECRKVKCAEGGREVVDLSALIPTTFHAEGVRGGSECIKVIARRGCAEGLSAKRSLRGGVHGGGAKRSLGGVRGGSECKKVIAQRGARRGARRV